MRAGFIGQGTTAKKAAANGRRTWFYMTAHDLRPKSMARLVEQGDLAAHRGGSPDRI